MTRDELKKQALTEIKKFHSFGDIFVSQREAERLLEAIADYVCARVKETDGK